MPLKPIRPASLRSTGLLALADLLVEQGDLVALAQRAPHDPADGQAAQVVGGVEVGDDRLQRGVGVAAGAGTVSTMASSSGREVVVVAGHADAVDGLALAGDGRDDRELDVVVVGAEVEEQLVDLVEHLVGPGVVRGRPC